MGGQLVKRFLKPYVLKIFLSNKNVSAQVVHSPTNHTVVAASTEEAVLRAKRSSGSYADVAAAAEIGQLVGERLKLKDIPAVAYRLERGQRYHGKRRAILDSLRDSGVKLL